MSDIFKVLLEKRRLRTIALVVVFLFVFSTAVMLRSYAGVEYWAVKAGGRTIAIVNSEENAKKVFSDIEKTYAAEGAEVVSVTPKLKTKQLYFKIYEKKPKIVSEEDAVKKVLAAKEDGKPVVQVTAVRREVTQEAVPFSTKEIATSALLSGKTQVKTKGVNGTAEVTSEVTTVNGVETARKVLSKKVVKQPVTQEVLKGTGGRSYSPAGAGFIVYVPAGTAGEKGAAVANYALKWVGNPYRWGGNDLRTGVDCSGFVCCVYQAMGVNVTRGNLRTIGYSVGTNPGNAQPGDIIIYSGHYGIYIGNNKLVHAMNAQNGIRVSTIGYNGKRILDIRRVYKSQ